MTSARVEASSLIPDLTHQTIDDGRLKFMQRLGAGGYGVVYRAIDTTSPCTSSNPEPKEYAVKVVQKAKPNTRSWRYQRREISAHNTLKDHPHILTLHQVIEDDSYIYHVLEYCPGGDLFSAVLERGMLMGNDELVKKVFVQILDAVHFCHENGIYHRDLKLENIMCMNDEATEVVVGDFGICTDASTSNSFGCGSKCYLSPECIGKDFNYKRYSPKTGDVWSLGILLVSMLVGCIPWKYASTDDQWFLNFMAHEEYLFRTLPISRKANTLLRRILTFDPTIRISIPELREEILRMDTFFVDPDEFDCASRWAQGHRATSRRQ
ncbi:Pkinase-domain-containing protein [Laetiporus sulphureus 93-53]|uniref:Pkinase-domain-containing protein n=1 Tax=Laetiporus sulphureus 93-53 TaxID=1314785 RepID=A0A165GKF8_9APHY|nr:Pkinase-domain-containing protein [Laetiporus sulphureus 93-53]KZT10476.1 Pkinase-domain-containing protein [Laetiporus sulphureus 93-53]